MGEVRRYGRLLRVQLRASAMVAMQYRTDFLVGALMSALWSASAVAPLWVVFRDRASVAGWSRAEALLVVAFFLALKAVLVAAVQPSLLAVVDHVRKGTLDFVLLKPADAEFLVSTAKLEPWKGTDLVGAALLATLALRELHRTPSPGSVAAAVLLWAGGAVMLHALLLMVVSLAFLFVKIDNLAYLLGSVYDAARWPASVFRGAVGWVFTLVIPLALMTTWPALALLGRLDAPRCAFALGWAAVLAAVARSIWTVALRRYTSAGG